MKTHTHTITAFLAALVASLALSLSATAQQAPATQAPAKQPAVQQAGDQQPQAPTACPFQGNGPGRQACIAAGNTNCPKLNCPNAGNGPGLGKGKNVQSPKGRGLGKGMGKGLGKGPGFGLGLGKGLRAADGTCPLIPSSVSQ